jgi:hypothetical protein
VVGAGQPTGQQDHVVVAGARRVERDVGQHRNAVRPGHLRPVQGRRVHLDAGAPQQVHQGDGLDLLEALGERHEHT